MSSSEVTDCVSCSNDNCIIRKNSRIEAIVPFIEKKYTLNCKKGQNFIIEGAPVNGLYFVFKGKVKVTKAGINGKEQIVRFAGDGEIVGHRGFAAGHFYQIGAVAIENSTLCSFPLDVLKEMLITVPTVTFDLMSFYSEELNRSETKVKKFAQMTVREKVIDALLYLNRKFGQKKGLLNITLSRREIADFAGTTDEQVIRVLSSLKREGLIIANGKRLGIVNLNALSKEISEHNFYIDS